MTIYSKELKEEYRSDVLVLGGGPSGLCAAVAAAREGASVILVEKYGFCGGMATAGLVAPFMTCYDSGGGRMLIRGLFSEIVDRLCLRGDAIHPSLCDAPSAFTSYITVGHKRVTPFRAEGLKKVADEMLAEAGVRILYHTSFADVLSSDGHIEKIVLLRKNGLCCASAKVIVDCTGDGDCAAAAGAAFEFGNDTEKKVQPATMFFRIGNVDSAKIEEDYRKNIDNFYRKDGVNYRSLHWWVEKAREAGDWDLDRVSIGLFRGVDEDEWSINTSRIMGIDGTDSESLTRGEIEGRRQVEEIFAFFRKYVPGCENAKLLQTGTTLGIRETRHIRGIKQLKTSDLLSCAYPSDSIAVCANSVDVHGKYGPRSNEYIALPEGGFYGIPYGTLVPEGFDNLLVAGRCLSAESDAAGAVRVMPPCMATGEAAGCAAALASASGIPVYRVDTDLLRGELRNRGVYLP